MRMFLLAVALLASPLSLLAGSISAHVMTVANGTQWSYTVFNDTVVDGDPNSNVWIGSFTLLLSAPVTLVENPPGWLSNSDGASYVSWFNADQDPLFPNDIAPGAQLGGFVITSLSTVSVPQAYEMATWNHALEEPGSPITGGALGPGVTPIPEPCTIMLCALGALGLMVKRPKEINTLYDLFAGK